MEKTKQPQNAKRRRQWVSRISPTPDAKRGGSKHEKQDKANFWRRAGGRYLPNEKGKALRKRHEKLRAKAKRARASRKKNRR